MNRGGPRKIADCGHRLLIISIIIVYGRDYYAQLSASNQAAGRPQSDGFSFLDRCGHPLCYQAAQLTWLLCRQTAVVHSFA